MLRCRYARELGVPVRYEIKITKLNAGGELINAVVVQLTDQYSNTEQWPMVIIVC
jgi:hypothetical protein